jgi:hypothetical protein
MVGTRTSGRPALRQAFRAEEVVRNVFKLSAGIHADALGINMTPCESLSAEPG